jgi:ubiquitin carboxyl-terminal hydrolase 22/27/51
MALTQHMPAFGCEHLDTDVIDKVRHFRDSPKRITDLDLVQYKCLNCPKTGSFGSLDEHFSENPQHAFAVSQKTVYCGRCNDLVYDPKLLNSHTKSNGNNKKNKKRKLTESANNDNGTEDDSYLTANSSQRPCGRSGVRGLFNLGETCYMNAVLQMMVHNPLLASYFLGMGHSIHTCPISKEPEKKESDTEDDEGDDQKKETQACVACGMTELFSDVTMVDQPLPAHAVSLLFASWKNIPVSGALFSHIFAIFY